MKKYITLNAYAHNGEYRASVNIFGAVDIHGWRVMSLYADGLWVHLANVAKLDSAAHDLATAPETSGLRPTEPMESCDRELCEQLPPLGTHVTIDAEHYEPWPEITQQIATFIPDATVDVTAITWHPGTSGALQFGWEEDSYV